MGPQLVVVGTSMGGLRALKVLLGDLPGDFPVPVVIVQHRSADSPSTLGAHMQEYTALPVSEVEDKEMIQPGRVYLAPADYHILVDVGAFALSTEAPVAYARPSIDVLFESAADVYAEGVVGIILTGASQDGAQGLAKIKQRGGIALVQAPETAECPVMPAAALEATPVDQVLPLAEIGPFLAQLCSTTARKTL
jgi:two-component system chemotaxis response regulator CheB